MKKTRERENETGQSRRLLAVWWPVLAWMAVIFVLSSQSSLGDMQLPPLFRALRKVGHVLEYSVLALLLGRALLSTWGARGETLTRALLYRVWWVGTVLATLYAFTDEYHQTFVPKRGGHLTDVLIDALSATAALGVWQIVHDRRLREGTLRGDPRFAVERNRESPIRVQPYDTPDVVES